VAVIACLRWPPALIRSADGTGKSFPDSAREAILDVCAQLTPVVEPGDDCVWMDWTGCGEAERLAEKLSAALARLSGAPAAAERAAARSPASPGGWHCRLGVAPLRFVAGALAVGDLAPVVADLAAVQSAVQPIELPFVRGFRVTEEGLPRLLPALRLRALRELDAEARATLAALDVHTLGDLAGFPPELLYGHVGRAADALLEWAAGRDARRVRALYPPARLEQRISAEELGLSCGGSAGAPADASRVQQAVFRAAEQLGAELERSRRACSAAVVAIGARRVARSFTPPVAAADQLGRVLWHMVQRLLAEAAQPDAGAASKDLRDDCVIAVTPAPYTGRQTTLFSAGRLDVPQKERKPHPLECPALAAIRARFGPWLRLCAAEAGPGVCREAVARYEAMRQFYS